VVVELTTNRLERVGADAHLFAGDRMLTVQWATPHQGRWLVAFEGVDDRRGADDLRGQVLSAEPLEDPEAMWVHELVGCHLVDQVGQDRGVVVAVESNPASDLLVLDGGGLVPLRFVTAHQPGIVRTDLPAGLLE
jgi:16S rRNA processing protein RimM